MLVGTVAMLAFGYMSAAGFVNAWGGFIGAEEVLPVGTVAMPAFGYMNAAGFVNARAGSIAGAEGEVLPVGTAALLSFGYMSAAGFENAGAGFIFGATERVGTVEMQAFGYTSAAGFVNAWDGFIGAEEVLPVGTGVREILLLAKPYDYLELVVKRGDRYSQPPARDEPSASSAAADNPARPWTSIYCGKVCGNHEKIIEHAFRYDLDTANAAVRREEILSRSPSPPRRSPREPRERSRSPRPRRLSCKTPPESRWRLESPSTSYWIPHWITSFPGVPPPSGPPGSSVPRPPSGPPPRALAPKSPPSSDCLAASKGRGKGSCTSAD